jgi:hypothetical protein
MFMGPGIIEVANGRRHFITYAGKLEGQRPAEDSYCVIYFEPHEHTTLKSWAGSWSRAVGYGRLERTDGSLHLGKVRTRGFAEFVEDGHGIRVLSHAGSGVPYELANWQDGRNVWQ